MKAKSIFIKSFIVLLIAFIFIALAVFNSDDKSFETDSNKLIMQYDFGKCCGVFEAGDGNLFFCLKDSVKFLNCNGQEKWSIDADFSEPVICHSKKILGISELKTNTIYIYNEEGKLYSVKPENKLLAFSVNSSGYCSSISKDNSAYRINVYNPKGEKILTYVHSEENIFPVNTAISPDGNILAISYVDTNNIEVCSKITFMYTDQNDIFASVQEKSNFVCGLNFLSNNDMIIIGENKVISERVSKNNLQEKWRINFEKKISMIDFNNDFIAVKLVDESNSISQRKSYVKFYDMSGKKIGEFDSNEQFDFLNVSAKNNYVMFGALNNFICVDSKGKILWKYSTHGDYKFAAFLNRPDKILFVSSVKAYIVNVKWKGE